MTRPPRPQRSIRVEDSLWFAAQAAADERGEVLSEEIRKFLLEYVAKGESK